MSDEQAVVEAPSETPTDTNAISVDNIPAVEVSAEPAKEPALTEGQQATFNDAIGGKVKLFREEQRKNEELQQENAALKAKLPVSSRPVIPDLPDQFADDFAGKMKLRDEAMVAQTAFDANERAESQTALNNQQAQHNQRIQDHQTSVTGYFDTAEKLSIDKNELLQANTNLINMGLPMETQNRLLTLPNGPQIAMFLAKNPIEASNLASMGVQDAAVAMATDLTTKASKMFSVPDNLPTDPVETLKGGGAREGDKGPKGATYE